MEIFESIIAAAFAAGALAIFAAMAWVGSRQH
jgi:hypothetical protein